MRALTAIAALSGLALSVSDAVSLEVVAGGTITRIDAETCRVAVGFTYVGDWPFPATSCNFDYIGYPISYGAITILTGPFGAPEQVSPEPVSNSDGYLAWIGPHAPGAEFNCRPSSTQTDIAISYSIAEDAMLELYYCDQPDPCPAPCHRTNDNYAGYTLIEIMREGGTVYAELPQGIGEFTILREIPVAVTSRTWSQMKSLFRQ